MQTFKKILLSFFSCVFIFCFISTLVIYPYMHSELKNHQDSLCRKQCAGKIDTLFLGSSYASYGLDPRVYDKERHCFSYNLSGPYLPMDSKVVLLKKELARNPIKTVFIELSIHSLWRDQKDEYGNGINTCIEKLDSFLERAAYLVKNVAVDDWLNVYSREFISGLTYYKAYLSGENLHNVDYAAKGKRPLEAADFALEELDKTEKEDWWPYLQKNIDCLDQMVALCKENNCRTIILVTPVSHATIWANDGWDRFYQWTAAYAKDNAVEFYDLNLIKTRYTLFSDTQDFFDGGHLCDAGAVKATQLLCDILNEVDAGKDISDKFFDSYEQMRPLSPYATK